MIDADRVVGRLGKPAKYAYPAACLGSCREDRQLKRPAVHCLRATVGEEQASGSYLAYGRRIETTVGPERIVQSVTVLGERRRANAGGSTTIRSNRPLDTSRR